jgi:hypothetical protein
MTVCFTHCRVSRCCVVASNFVMYTLDRICCLILIKKVVCIFSMHRDSPILKKNATAAIGR